MFFFVSNSRYSVIIYFYRLAFFLRMRYEKVSGCFFLKQSTFIPHTFGTNITVPIRIDRARVKKS